MLIDDLIERVPPVRDMVRAVIRADDVACLGDDRGPEDMPSLRLPFPAMWIEWAGHGRRHGVLCKEINGEGLRQQRVAEGGEFQDVDANALMMYIFSATAGLGIKSEGVGLSFVEQTGECPYTTTDRFLLSGPGVCLPGFRPDMGSLLPEQSVTELGRRSVQIAALTICLMHCKNVTAVEQVPPPALQKARQKRGKRPLFRYHVLNIEPMAKVLRRDGGLGSGNGIAQALHICRGHFKDYRQSGLFGKVKGIFWWDQHARGDAKRGVVTKDYAVKATEIIH